MAAMRNADIMTATEVGRYLGLSRNAVYDAAGRGEIPHRRVGRRLIFSRAAIVVWLGAKEREVPEGATHAGSS